MALGALALLIQHESAVAVAAAALVAVAWSSARSC
jgi:hypothetical protein